MAQGDEHIFSEQTRKRGLRDITRLQNLEHPLYFTSFAVSFFSPLKHRLIFSRLPSSFRRSRFVLDSPLTVASVVSTSNAPTMKNLRRGQTNHLCLYLAEICFSLLKNEISSYKLHRYRITYYVCGVILTLLGSNVKFIAPQANSQHHPPLYGYLK